MTAVLIMVINKAIKDIFYFSCLYKKVNTANTKEATLARIIKIIIKNCSVVDKAIGSRRIIERVTNKLKIKKE
ncbi:hypothetical protein ACTHO5_10750 [Cytobacillus praedii]|uniref:hypothetical protein n=1 Tax=Cytobacillus praedii TaxID=1742358 RepID=UPI003F7CE74E